jgi:DNA anti-recombination protein RmuC
MAVDLSALIQLLEDDPAQRTALRQAILGDVPDLTSALASLTGEVAALAQAQGRTEERLSELAQAQGRTEERLSELAQAQGRTEERLSELADDLRALTESHRKLAESVRMLLDTVRGMNDKLARLDGESLERRYREKGQAYFAPLARRLQLLDGNALGVLLDDAEEAGRLTHQDVNDVLLADAVFSGRGRLSRAPLHLVVEASVTIDRHDVRRACERADLLARAVDGEVIAVVAGEMVPSAVVAAAQEAGAWCVTDGHAVAPEDDIESR